MFLMNQFGTNAEQTIHLVSYLASVHDIGKVHPAFQSKDKELLQRVKDSAPEYFSNNQMELIQRNFYHEHYSARVLQRIWLRRGYEKELCTTMSAVIALHHQRPADLHALAEPRNRFWTEMQDEMEEKLAAVFLMDTVLVSPNYVDATLMMISSIIVLMDWAASSKLFSNAEEMDPEMIRNRADQVLRMYTLISDSVFPEINSFSEMFPAIRQPRPLQMSCAELGKDALLTIIEAPMGEGKTEAALYLAARQCNETGARGIYMALPSQASSNQIFTRINAMLADLNYGDARLLHSTAFLSQQISNVFVSEDEAAAAKWIRPSRMGFLGTNAVGTVDQAMATVLCTRFSMIRLIGLSNKILIIDEIHAYDLYMTQIIETLLRWCRDCSIPVILLSATMQAVQKQRYLSCFGVDCYSREIPAYPLLTQVLPDGKMKEVRTEASAHYYYRFRPLQTEFDADAVANMALESVKQGGCTAIIANTVGHAQQIYQALCVRVENRASVILFHSRFPLKRRAEIETQCVTAFGRDRTNRPGKGILVATQVVEQSIDLDFDGMISELAPIDLLLQRAGRLHRHRENIRPEPLREPVLNILTPSVSAVSELERRYGPSGYVYDPFVLYNTEQQLKTERIIQIPEDIRNIIDETYAAVTEENREAWLKRSMRGILETAKAKSCIWPMPEKKTFFPLEETIYYDVPDHDDGFDSASEASTRLGDESIRIAFCEESDFDRYVKQDIPASEQSDVFLNSVSVRLKPHLLHDSASAKRVQSGKLAGIWILRGNETVELSSCVIRNDHVLGILWEVK